MPNPSSTAQSADGAAAGACCSSGSPSPGAGPVELSAKGLHDLAVRAFRTGNRGRLSLCESLRVLSETRLFLELGFPSIAAYADTFFQLRRAQAYEYVRVAHALVELTELRDAFGLGQMGWSVLRAVTRVASAKTQADWIEFARARGAERTLAEAKDALQRRRDKPRDSSFGLPNLDQKLVLRFPRRRPREVPGGGRGTPPRMRRQILAREGGRCANPRCRNRAAHCHHIEFQADGGKTCLANEAGLCETCHALVHAGLLGLSGDANGELKWSPAAVGDSLERNVAADGDTADELPVSRLQAESGNGNRAAEGRSESTAVDSSREPASGNNGANADHGLDLDALAHGLVRLGVPAARSSRIIGAVVQARPPGELAEAGVLRSALAAI